MSSTTRKRRRIAWEAGGEPGSHADVLAVEEPLEIRIDTQPLTVTMRTPGHDRELAAGFLLSEGLIRSAEDIRAMKPSPRNRANVLDVFLAPKLRVDFNRLTRHVFASSSCGLCGRTTIEAVRRQFRPVRARFAVPAERLLELPDRMRGAQATFDTTGGLHAAAVFSASGELAGVHEDIGRHNAVDKVIGRALLDGALPLDRHLLLVSGRASFEIMQKALAARIPIVCAISAPSSLAVEFARESGQTLVGFLRGERLNVYAGGQRLGFPEGRRKIRKFPAKR